MLIGGSDYLRSSIETLGNSGYRGLLDQSLKLGTVNVYKYVAYMFMYTQFFTYL